MKYKIIYHFDENLLTQAASLHYEALSYRSFITNFGPKFLFELYKGILANNLGFFVIANENSNLYGFVLGCFDSEQIMRLLLKRFWTFAKIIIPIILQKPTLTKKLLESILYSRKEGIEIKSELLVTAVKDNFRSKKIGTNLIKKLDDEFVKHDIIKYKITVHKKMDKSNNFYLKNGMRLFKTFNFYNTPWNLYLKDISAKF